MVGGDDDHGAFLAIRIENAKDFARKMEEEGIVCDARGEWLRLCPDCLTRDAELRGAAKAVGRLLRRSQ
jgi:kynureninase